MRDRQIGWHDNNKLNGFYILPYLEDCFCAIRPSLGQKALADQHSFPEILDMAVVTRYEGANQTAFFLKA